MTWILVIVGVALLLWIGPPLLGWLVFSAGPYLLAAAALVGVVLWVMAQGDGDG